MRLLLSLPQTARTVTTRTVTTKTKTAFTREYNKTHPFIKPTKKVSVNEELEELLNTPSDIFFEYKQYPLKLGDLDQSERIFLFLDSIYN